MSIVLRVPRRRTLLRCLLLLATAVFLAGCTKGMSDLRAWVVQQKARKGVPIDPLPVIKTFETFIYADQDMRDPFSPSSVELQADTHGASGPRPDANRVKQPLEMFALDTLKMVGTIGAGSGTQALIKDPGGVIHRVKAGDYMGQNYGRVTVVADDHVELVEMVSNGNNGWMERPASIGIGEQ